MYKLKEIKQLQKEGYTLGDSLKIAFKSFYYNKKHIFYTVDEYIIAFVIFLGFTILLLFIF